jgi:hypothetical protein
MILKPPGLALDCIRGHTLCFDTCEMEGVGMSNELFSGEIPNPCNRCVHLALFRQDTSCTFDNIYF